MRKKITLLFFALVAFVTTFAQSSNDADYSNGVLVVNEDWFGHQNSSVNYLSADGEWTYNLIDNVGCTACYGAIFNGKFYIISKQAKDNGASVSGGMITICDAKTMAVEKQIENIDDSKVNFQGRSFVGVTEHKGYVSTSDGIYVLDLDQQVVAKQVVDQNGNGLKGECGNMLLAGGKVYAVTANNGIAVIDIEEDKVASSFAGSYKSIVQAKDGSIWVNKQGGICKLNLESNEVENVSLAAGINAPYVDFAWTASTFCASAKKNTLYWGYTSGWTGPDHIYKYDIDSNKFSEVVDLSADADKWVVYGCSFRVDPRTDELYASLFKSWGSTDYVVRKYDADGKQLAEYPMTGKLNYWFPGMFVFPTSDTATGINQVQANGGQTATPVAYYTTSGQRISAPSKGINLVRMSDGTVRKVVIK